MDKTSSGTFPPTISVNKFGLLVPHSLGKGRGHWSVIYAGTQSLINTFSQWLAQKLCPLLNYTLLAATPLEASKGT